MIANTSIGLADGGRAAAPQPVLAQRVRINVDDSELQIGLDWLLRLRRGAVAGQALSLVFVRFVLDLPLPYGRLIGLIAFTSVTNAALAALPRRSDRRWLCPTILSVDVAILTAMLAFSGGATNPFTAFYAPTTLPRVQHVPTLGRVEWEHIDRVLCHCAGNITQAAALLGLHRRSLQRKLAKRPPAR